MNARDREFADAAQVIEQSLVMRAAARCAAAIPAAARESGVVRALAGVRVTRVEWVIAAIAGCATHMLLLQVLSPRVAPVKPLAYAMVVAFAVFATVAGLITARSDSTATADSSAGTANTRNS